MSWNGPDLLAGYESLHSAHSTPGQSDGDVLCLSTYHRSSGAVEAVAAAVEAAPDTQNTQLSGSSVSCQPHTEITHGRTKIK